jgi:DNA polymerase-3 subunit alpha
MGEFVHLHMHSEYSLLDGANQVQDLVNRVKEIGQTAVAITDHGVMFGAIEFYKAATAAGIKPIIGCEVYISPTTRHDKGPRAKANHLVLLAQNLQGYLNLCKLTSIGYLEGFYRKPRIDHEVLAKHHEGLIALSACLKGEVAEGLNESGEKAAIEAAARYRDIFGPERFFIEVQDHGIGLQHTMLKHAKGIAGELGLQIVASNDAHFLTGGHHHAHDILLCIGTGKVVSETNRMRYSAECYIKTEAEMRQLFREFPGAVDLTGEIASSIDLKIPFKQRLYPKFPWTDGKSAREYLRERVAEGLVWRYKTVSESLRAQADFELSVIEKTGFEDYFLVVWDFIRYAREQGIPVGPGRGSGAGSIVAYTLGITDVDPIAHGLLFERFLNPERVSAPDFDIDFCTDRRGEVIEYVRQKYGEDNVAQIITFGTLQPKAALRDVGRVLEVPLSRVDQVAKLLPTGPAGPKTLKHALVEYPEFKKEYDNDPLIRQLVDTAQMIEGTSRNAGIHAAGVVIADQELASLIPIYQAPGTNDRVVQYTMGLVEELGFLKMDFLGLKNLTIIHNAVLSVKASEGIDIDWDSISLEDPKTYEFLRRGMTAGIFQLESSGMRDVVRRLQPTCFADISAILALYRPGPIEAGMVDDYIDRKHGRKPVEYPHPSLEPVLRETYGTIIYQEQVMKIAQVMAGYSLGAADLLRRAMGKKKKEDMDKERPKFVDGCVKHGHSAELAGSLFDTIAMFAGYGFNKSHSVAYAVVTFRTAYLMAHHPVAYMAALLTNEINGAKSNEKIPAYIQSCREMGIDVEPPDVNESDFHFNVTRLRPGGRGGAIRFGLGAIKGVGEGVVRAIVAERQKNGPYKSLRDFCERVPMKQLNSRVIEALIRTGAFDSISPNRHASVRSAPRLLENAAEAQRERASGQSNLLALLEATPGNGKAKARVTTNDDLDDVPDWDAAEKLRQERELIGFYVSGHPLDRWRLDFDFFARVHAAHLAAAEDPDADLPRELREALKAGPRGAGGGGGGYGRSREGMVTMMGLITAVINKVTSSGKPMAFVTFEDFTGAFEVVVFPSTYEKCLGMLAVGRALVVEGRVDVGGRGAKILAERLHEPQTLREQRVKALEIHLKAADLNVRLLHQLAQHIDRHKGSLACRFVLEGSRHSVAVTPEGRAVRIAPTEEALRGLERLPLRPRLTYAS